MLIISLKTLESTYYVFGLSTCHSIVHYELSLLLFGNHSSYGFSSKPQYFNVPVIYFQNSNSSWRVSYIPLFSLRYMTGMPFLYPIKYSYLFGSTCDISVTRVSVTLPISSHPCPLVWATLPCCMWQLTQYLWHKWHRIVTKTQLQW